MLKSSTVTQGTANFGDIFYSNSFIDYFIPFESISFGSKLLKKHNLNGLIFIIEHFLIIKVAS